MEVKVLSLDEITTFGYCSMQYHLRFRYQLPWFPGSGRVALAWVAREATREYFRLQMTKFRGRSGDLANRVFGKGIAKALTAFPQDAALLARGREEALFGLRSIFEQYEAPKDRVVGFDIPYEISVSRSKGRNVLVKGNLDTILFRNVGTPMEQAVCITFIATGDPQEDLARAGSIRQGFAFHAMRNQEGIGKRVPLRHKFLPVFVRSGKDKMRLMMGVKDAPNMDSLRRVEGLRFISVCLQALKGIEAEFAMQTGDSDKCRHCPYVAVCRHQLATKSPTESDLRVMSELEETSQFKDWPVGG